MKKLAYLFIALGAALWGTIGLFVQGLSQLGLSSFQIVAVRLTTGAVILLIYILIKDRSLLKIKFRDWPYFVGTGIFSFVFFNWFYFITIKETSLSLAVILLYTAPIFVAVLSRIFFGESFNSKKVVSLILTFVGIAFVIGFLPSLQGVKIQLFGFLVGLGSGLGYALYSIFGKAALKKYSPLTVIIYTFVFASIAALPFSGLWQIIEVFSVRSIWFYILGLGLFPTALALFLYTTGLKYVESSKAAIIATFEPVVATLLGIVVYGDRLNVWQILGMALVIAAIINVQERKQIR